MRKIIVANRITMDGVLQAPSGPEDDPQYPFKWGGWATHYQDDQTFSTLSKIMSTPFDLLLGRRTYEVFASYWPYEKGAIADTFNRINKYVVATTPVDLSWETSILINKDVVNELKKLKEQDGPDLLVFGSSVLMQTLLSNHMVDVLHTWIFPVTIGEGQKLFEGGTQPQQWKLTESVVSKTGVIFASYALDGEVKLGSLAPDEVAKAALGRREKWKADRKS
ncbi:MAG TPA: dihydrofolate reductase family protein [Flavipsychrobacter sp.]|nr:dihydrofolate reductase family protein [Flavipsychrobacter sp.]